MRKGPSRQRRAGDSGARALPLRRVPTRRAAGSPIPDPDPVHPLRERLALIVPVSLGGAAAVENGY